MDISLNRNLTTKQAAEFLNISPRTLEQWRWERRGPSYSKYGRRVLYRMADLLEFQERSIIRVEL